MSYAVFFFYTYMQFNSLSDYAESFKLINCVVFLLYVLKNYKSALSQNMRNNGLMASSRKGDFNFFKTSPTHLILTSSDYHPFPR